MIDRDKKNRAVRGALIKIDVAYSKKNKNDTIEEFLRKYDLHSPIILKDLLPWQREILGALSGLYMAGFFDEANYIDNLR